MRISKAPLERLRSSEHFSVSRFSYFVVLELTMFVVVAYIPQIAGIIILLSVMYVFQYIEASCSSVN